MRKLSITDLDLAGKRVLMRVDFNVPQNADGTVRDDTRIKAALQSINYCRERGAKLILMSHLGRPGDPKKAETDEEREKIAKKNALLKMDPIAAHLRKLIGGNVTKADGIVGPEVEAAVAKHGALHVLVNCAGIGAAEKAYSKRGPADLAVFTRVIQVNLIGTFLMTAKCAAGMQTLAPLKYKIKKEQ